MSLLRHYPSAPHAFSPSHKMTYLLAVLFNFHGLLVAYSSSTYMEQFTSQEAVGTLYTISSLLAIAAFLFFSRLLARFGNYRLTLLLALLETCALLGIGFAFGSTATIIAFVVFMTINPLLYLNIDIFSETLLGNHEKETGTARGLTLAFMSAAAAIAPFTLALIVGADATRLNLVYFVSALIFLFFSILTLVHFKHFNDPVYHHPKIRSTLSTLWHYPDLRNVCAAHFMLQYFFAWTIIYMPLYLAKEIGLSWDSIGAIIGVGLLAYALLEYPIGRLADIRFGEKEMMAIGFMILAVSSASISYMAGATVFFWMLLMFINRAGAALVEVTTESYFFKHTKGSDADVMSFFRLLRPLALIAGSLSGSILLTLLPFNLAFVVLGLLLALSIFFVIGLKDTR